ncbi:MAG: NADH-quinone oxidoreductase subunit J [Caldilineaceae bacterium]|nr:NADH-quinone oxidoreductase subunit J [Caldilineaceae bacterium]
MPDLASHLPTLQQAIFIPIAGFVVVAAIFTVVANNLFHSALGLVATLFGVAGVYVMLEAEFLAVSQILVYVGAISTLITFAIMLTRGMMFGRTATNNKQTLAGVLVAALFFLAVIGFAGNIPWPNVGAELADGEVMIARLGELFVTTYLLPFQMMALLLLVALAGAILLARDDM